MWRGGVEEWPYTMTFYGLPLLFKFLDIIWGFSGNTYWWTFMLCYLRVWFLRFKGIWLDFTPSSFSIKGDWVLTRIRWFWGYSPPYFRFADFLNKVVIPAPATCLSIIGLLCGEQLKLRMWTKGTMRFSSIFKDVLLFLATWCKEQTQWKRPWCWEGEGCRQEKRATEDEMVGWHYPLNEQKFEKTLGDSEGQGSLVCCSSWSWKESDST